MRRFECQCGSRVFFENTVCLNCDAEIGFDPNTMRMVAWRRSPAAGGEHFRPCRNTLEYNNCNWLLPAGTDEDFCLSCRLNRTIPHLDSGNNLLHWATLEKDKRRLVYSLIRLGLPVKSKTRGWPEGLAFDFIEDQRSNPAVLDTFITTGHHDGVITIHIAEADPLHRLQMRINLGEVYRTLLGHFRHESGHYYYSVLLEDHNLGDFRDLFGDERTDYTKALENYYSGSASAAWPPEFITAYAGSHPLEDWAECWAHYLLIHDALETVCTERGETPPCEIDEMLGRWVEYTVELNQIARSLGLEDPYPFAMSDPVRDKLRFVDHAIRCEGAPG